MTAVITERTEDSSRECCGGITFLQPAEGRFQRRRNSHPERGQPGGADPTGAQAVSILEPSHKTQHTVGTHSEQADELDTADGLLPFRNGRDVPRQEKQDREKAEPGVIVCGPKDAGEPRSLKSQDVPDSAQHSTAAARHPGFANRRCTSLMERSRNPPSQ
jgi:hypothetical protein